MSLELFKTKENYCLINYHLFLSKIFPIKLSIFDKTIELSAKITSTYISHPNFFTRSTFYDEKIQKYLRNFFLDKNIKIFLRFQDIYMF